MNSVMAQVIYNSCFKCHFMLYSRAKNTCLKHICWFDQISIKYFCCYRIMNIISLGENPSLCCCLSLST